MNVSQIDADPLAGQIADVAHAGPDDVGVAQVLVDRLGLGRRLDDDQRLAGPLGGGLGRLGRRLLGQGGPVGGRHERGGGGGTLLHGGLRGRLCHGTPSLFCGTSSSFVVRRQPRGGGNLSPAARPCQAGPTKQFPTASVRRTVDRVRPGPGHAAVTSSPAFASGRRGERPASPIAGPDAPVVNRPPGVGPGGPRGRLPSARGDRRDLGGGVGQEPLSPRRHRRR